MDLALRYVSNEKMIFFFVIIFSGTLLIFTPSLLTSMVSTHTVYKPCEKFLPNVILIGVTKCGTGALRMFLSAHPDVGIAPVKIPREKVKPNVNFFDLHYEKGLQWYLNKTPCSEPDKVIIDHTPQYFWKSHVPKRVHSFNSKIKLLLILREPISRTVSLYLQLKDMRETFDTSTDFETFIEENSSTAQHMISTSTYILHLQEWLKLFDLDQINIVDGNEFVKNPLRQLKEIEKFLEISPFFTAGTVYYNKTRGFYCVKMLRTKRGFQCAGEKKGRVHPKLKDSTIFKLRKYFEPYNLQLFQTIGRRFNWTLP